MKPASKRDSITYEVLDAGITSAEDTETGGAIISIYMDVYVNDEKINNGYAVDISELVGTATKAGEYYPLTCGCGYPMCAGLEEPIVVEHHDALILWKLAYPEPERVFSFSAAKYRNSLWEAMRWIKELSEESKFPFEIGPYGFEQTDFDKCYKIMGSIHDESDLPVEKK